MLYHSLKGNEQITLDTDTNCLYRHPSPTEVGCAVYELEPERAAVVK